MTVPCPHVELTYHNAGKGLPHAGHAVHATGLEADHQRAAVWASRLASQPPLPTAIGLSGGQHGNIRHAQCGYNLPHKQYMQCSQPAIRQQHCLASGLHFVRESVFYQYQHVTSLQRLTTESSTQHPAGSVQPHDAAPRTTKGEIDFRKFRSFGGFPTKLRIVEMYFLLTVQALDLFWIKKIYFGFKKMNNCMGTRLCCFKPRYYVRYHLR
jgi:hypothetical protein